MADNTQLLRTIEAVYASAINRARWPVALKSSPKNRYSILSFVRLPCARLHASRDA